MIMVFDSLVVAAQSSRDPARSADSCGSTGD
jgi:hypothetical protein